MAQAKQVKPLGILLGDLGPRAARDEDQLNHLSL